MLLAVLGAYYVMPRFTELDDPLSLGITLVTCFLIGQSIRGLWRMRRWAVYACAVFIVLIEIGVYQLGHHDNLASVAVRTGLWLALLAWAYGANKQHFT
jgi:hypothetical protein